LGVNHQKLFRGLPFARQPSSLRELIRAQMRRH
jgi:hypothetical protein